MVVLAVAAMANVATAQTLVGNPFVVGYDGWEDTFDYVTGPTNQLNSPAEPVLSNWGVLLVTDTGLAESCNQWPRQAEKDGGGNWINGHYYAWNMVNKSVAIGQMPATYNLTATLPSVMVLLLGGLFGFGLLCHPRR